jgi:hypothetical protein
MSKLGPVGFVRSLGRILRGKPQVPPSLADNELLRTLLQRRSVRSFTAQAIPDDVFAAILEAGRVAPSSVNLQTWSFAAFTSESWAATFDQPLPFRGQRAVIVMGDTHRVRQVMNIAAEALGVSSVMLSETGRSGLLDAAYLKETLALPDRVTPLLTSIFGYARGAYPLMPPKLPLDQICFEGRYREADPAVMADWQAQMMAGYKASHMRSSFDAQLRVYQAKIGKAEADLRQMIFGKPER